MKISIIWHWRYWPMELLYLPLTLYIITIGFLRTGKLFYFAAANPKISLGGFAGDSKYHIINHIPNDFKPKSIFIPKNVLDFNVVETLIKSSGLKFPLIAKPDLGESGFLVEKLINTKSLKNYHFKYSMDYILQEYIDYDIELSVLVYKKSHELKISSITQREYLKLTGDGKKNIKQLLKLNFCSKFRFNQIKIHLKPHLEKVLPYGKVYQPLKIGNLDFGATYVDKSNLINEPLTQIFEDLNNKIDLFNYARYDLKCGSLEDFEKGNFKILEINGTKGEPIHIYDTSKNLFIAYKEIFKHWEYILQISKSNINNGAKYPSVFSGFKILYSHYKSKKEALKRRETTVK